MSPILRSATDAQGFLTVDTSGGQLPLNDPLNGRFEGQLFLEQFSVTPGDMAGPLIKLFAKLQSVVDPRFAFGDQVTCYHAHLPPISSLTPSSIGTVGYGRLFARFTKKM